MGQYAIQSPLEEFAGFCGGHAFCTAIKQCDTEDLLYTGDCLCCGRLCQMSIVCSSANSFQPKDMVNDAKIANMRQVYQRRIPLE